MFVFSVTMTEEERQTELWEDVWPPPLALPAFRWPLRVTALGGLSGTQVTPPTQEQISRSQAPPT